MNDFFCDFSSSFPQFFHNFFVKFINLINSCFGKNHHEIEVFRLTSQWNMWAKKILLLFYIYFLCFELKKDFPPKRNWMKIVGLLFSGIFLFLFHFYCLTQKVLPHVESWVKENLKIVISIRCALLLDGKYLRHY